MRHCWRAQADACCSRVFPTPMVCRLTFVGLSVNLCSDGRPQVSSPGQMPSKGPDLSYLQGLAFTCLYLLYIRVTRNSLAAFDCTTSANPSGVRTLDGNPDILCSWSDPVWKTVRGCVVAASRERRQHRDRDFVLAASVVPAGHCHDDCLLRVAGSIIGQSPPLAL